MMNFANGDLKCSQNVPPYTQGSLYQGILTNEKPLYHWHIRESGNSGYILDSKGVEYVFTSCWSLLDFLQKEFLS